jgi:hypothetical protein
MPSKMAVAAVNLIRASSEFCDHITVIDPVELDKYLSIKYPDMTNQIVKLVTANIRFQIASLNDQMKDHENLRTDPR